MPVVVVLAVPLVVVLAVPVAVVVVALATAHLLGPEN